MGQAFFALPVISERSWRRRQRRATGETTIPHHAAAVIGAGGADSVLIGWQVALLLWIRSFARGILLVSVSLLPCGCGVDTASVGRGVGAPLPEGVLTGLSAEESITAETLRGTPIIMNFWATWCVPCRKEMPSLERLSRRVGAHGVRVIGVTVDQDLNLAREFVRSYGLTFPLYADAQTKALQSALGVRALPETVLVSADGRIVARVAGAQEWDSPDGVRFLESALGLRLH